MSVCVCVCVCGWNEDYWLPVVQEVNPRYRFSDP